MTAGRGFIGGALLLALGATAAAQIPFSLAVTQPGQNASSITNGGTVTMQAAAGGSATVQLVATYSGTGQVSIAQSPNVVGSTAFTATLAGSLPLSLTPGRSATVTITFSPTTATGNTAQLSLLYVETTSTGTTNGGTISVSLQGASPVFSLSYVLSTNQNVVPVSQGGQVVFPATPLGTTVQAALSITNTGTGPGTVTGISLTGSAFRLQGVPLLPATIAIGQSIVVTIFYTPAAVATDSGQITISLGSGSPITAGLTGSGTAPSFTYQIVGANPPVTLSSGGTISFPGTNAGQTNSVTVRVTNSGNAGGTVNSISLSGASFQLASIPTLPQPLSPNASLTFTVTFAPTQPGSLSGSLTVNSDVLSLSGTGLGSLLVYSYVTGGTTITLSAASMSVVFSPVMITQSQQLTLNVTNQGTLPATISNIGVAQAGGPYTVAGVPALPSTLAPNASFQLSITFTPTTLGYANGALILDSTSISNSITLVGNGTQPPPLPSYTIAGPTGATAPFTQPAVSLSLANGYPVEISGTLTINVTGALPADPAIQFATGGKTVSFTIPANQTAAVFGSQGTQLGLQTGTVASSVTLTPSFATQAGNVDLTPAVPTSLQFAISPAAPQLIAIQVTSSSPTSISVQITGFATTRTLASSSIQIKTAPGFSMPTSQFTIDLSQIATLWFQSTPSQAFGGEFTLTVPFTFQGLATNQNVINSITSVSATITNQIGASNSIQAAVQ